MGRRRNKGRPVDGILLLDKPVGASSNGALQAVKRLFDARKAGHTGSLDPLASGLLPVCFGEATKVSAFLLDADKQYRVQACIGSKTDTGDAEGAVIAQSQAALPPESEIRAKLQDFMGEQQQIPPMYSALKHKGRRLYELAREGKQVEREPRRIRIDVFELIAASEGSLELHIRCSKGTYVRTLVEDFAESLGLYAHVSGLRRLAVGPFGDTPRMHDMADLEARGRQGMQELDAALLPLSAAVADWPEVNLDADSAFYFGRGQPVQVPQSPTTGWVRVHDASGKLLALGEILEDGRVAPKRVLQGVS